MADIVNGIDRADGLEGRPGTPTPPEGVVISSPNGGTEVVFNELPDSPEIERGEQGTISHRFNTSWSDGLTRLATLGRGLVQTDSYGNRSKIVSSKLQHQRGGYGLLTVVSESVSWDSPPDEFHVYPSELGLNIMKHPRYFYALMGTSKAEELLNQCVIRRLQDYFANPNAMYRDAQLREFKISLGYLGATGTDLPVLKTTKGSTLTPIPGTDMAKRAAMEIVQKYWRNEENPYIVGWELVWSRFYFRPQWLNPGGYVEDPIEEASPQLPEYFWVSPAGDSIFSHLSWFNPQSYSSSGARGDDVTISWLRKADHLDYQRTWFRVDRSWIGTPVGFWDPELMNQGPRPRIPDDYVLPNVPST